MAVPFRNSSQNCPQHFLLYIAIYFFFLKDMNEPASFVHGTVGGNCLGDPLLENPPYMPRKELRIYLCLFFVFLINPPRVTFLN